MFLLLILCVIVFSISLQQVSGTGIKENTRIRFIACQLLLATIVIIFFVGLVVAKGQQANFYDLTFAISLFVSILLLIFTILIWQSPVIVKYLDNKYHSTQMSGKSDKLSIDTNEQIVKSVSMQQKWAEELLNLVPIPMLLIEPKTAQVTFANQAADKFAGGELTKDISHTNDCFTDILGNFIPHNQIPGVRVASGERLQSVEMEWHSSTGVHSLVVYADTLPAKYDYPETSVLVLQDITNVKQLEKDLSLGDKQLHLLLDVISNFLPNQPPLALIDIIYRKLAGYINWDCYFNYLVVDNSQLIELVSYEGISQEDAEKIQRLSFSQGVCGMVAQAGRTIAIENVLESNDSSMEFIRSLGITAFCGYPLIVQEKLLGVFSFGSRSQPRFTSNEKAIMQVICDQIASTMERENLISALQAQTGKLQEVSRMKDEFLAILTHELRSPLNAILGWSQLLRRKKLNNNQITQAIETIERNAKNQIKLVQDLLDVSSIIRGKLQFNSQTCSLIPIIKSAIAHVDLAAKAKDITVDFCYPPNLDNPQFLVSGDPDRLEQIFWNLLFNAIKFTPPGGEIEIRLTKILQCSPYIEYNQQLKVTSYAQIKVTDSGIGIHPSFLPYVFDRFRQADSSNTRSYSGLGVGLALVRYLVEMHGGMVDVDSLGENQGTTFTVKLPLVSKNKAEALTTSAKILPNSPPESLFISLLGVQVLVVDDEVDCLAFMIDVLEECQAEVQAVTSVSEALQVISQNPPDVLISDIYLPGEDGYALIRKLRSQSPEKGGKIPAAALTSYNRIEERLRAMQAGYQLHLPKPVQPSELATVVAILTGQNYGD